MSCIYFVTTGISLRDSARCWIWREEELARIGMTQDGLAMLEGISPLKELVANQGGPKYFVELHKKRELVHEAMGQTLEASLGNVDAVLDKYIDLSCWSHDRYRLLPAELATLFKMLAGANPIIKPEDTIVFLGGETNAQEAVLCWRILQRIAEEKQLLPPGNIRLHDSLFAWDPKNRTKFNDALEELRELFEATKRGHRLAYVLTGGFKGVLMGISVLQCRKIGGDSKIFYIHEESNALVILDTTSQGLAASTEC